MPHPCPDCGATLADGELCADLFWTQQQQELLDPPYYAVHHLSVPAYMLQHDTYSRDGWLVVRKLMGEFLFEGLTPQYARHKYRDDMDGGNRKTSITRGERLTEVKTIRWSRTVADVRLDTAEQYCEDVRKWAESVFNDTAALVKDLPPNE